MEEAQKVKVTKEMEAGEVRFSIVIPNDQANIHLILDEEKFFSLLDALRDLGEKLKEEEKNV
ncbi:hypothetical protein LEP1GSC188_3117 [Leptospira weilii serovar Topaz str. LT2116]|uniref:Uncharacterized protein n=1 Tax=Leptospira weilii serovar Topaz str. LT2116 TaxID=1088540 RepID=M3FKD1_9LEPT|nr:hypothetical protein LEP1GSC188_3117 [Leptospira weilii serovar Topaz str. LT2116]